MTARPGTYHRPAGAGACRRPAGRARDGAARPRRVVKGTPCYMSRLDKSFDIRTFSVNTGPTGIRVHTSSSNSNTAHDSHLDLYGFYITIHIINKKKVMHTIIGSYTVGGWSHFIPHLLVK